MIFRVLQALDTWFHWNAHRWWVPMWLFHRVCDAYDRRLMRDA